MTLKHQWDRLSDVPGNPSENLPPLILFFSDIRTDPSREKTIMTQAIKRCSPDKHPPLFWFLSNIHESLCQDCYKTLASWTNKAEYTPDILPNERVWWWRCSRGYVWVPQFPCPQRLVNKLITHSKLRWPSKSSRQVGFGCWQASF